MTATETSDRGLPEMGALSRLAPDAARAERVRRRCRAQMSSHNRRGTRPGAIGHALRLLPPALVSGLCAVYLWLVAALTIRVILLR